MSKSNYILMKERADELDELSNKIVDVLRGVNVGGKLKGRLFITCRGFSEICISDYATLGAIADSLDKRKAELDAKSKKIREKLAMIDELLGCDND